MENLENAHSAGLSHEAPECADIRSSVEARAAAIEAKAQGVKKKKDDSDHIAFVMDCLNSNKVGDATLFSNLFRQKYVFVQEWEQFLFWDKNYWSIDKRDRRALADSERVCREYINALSSFENPETELTRKVRKRVDSLRTPNGRRQMLECVTTIDDPMVISADQLDQQPYLIATPTGVVDLRTGECNPGRQDQYILNPCPTPWTGLDTPAPNFERFILTCMNGDQEIADFLIRLLGYGLLGKKHLHIWAIMYGPRSRNGKDTLMSVVKHVLGKKLHIRFPVAMLVENKFPRDSSQPQADLMALRGTRIAYASEANGRQVLDQAKIKDLTGGGYITARGLTDRDMTEWQQSALLLLLTNYLPKLDATDDGFNARTICIEWPIKFVPNPTKDYERLIDYKMAQKLEAEASGILACLVRGCMDVLENGLRIPEKVLEYTKDQIDSFDDIGKFLRECCDIEDAALDGTYQTRIPSSDLLKICNWWCKKMLGNSYPYTPKKFTPALEKKGIQTKKSNVMYYLGVTVRPEILDEYYLDTADAEDRRGI